MLWFFKFWCCVIDVWIFGLGVGVIFVLVMNVVVVNGLGVDVV